MSFRSFLVCALLFVATASSFAGVSKKDIQALPEHYRNWLTKEVNYIITDEEKEAFVHLASDADRDKFIERFWEIRNPDPGSPSNRYKDEIYERIAYANQYFGHENGTPGWMTDMGRIYITLGAPKQKAKYLSFANVRPMEIWFYDNAHPALPPFFNVIFYQREAGGAFKLYSPYMDGPNKLVSSYQAESTRPDAFQVIDKEAGREVARTTLSLIPDEPTDISTAESSLSSDVMLSTIKGLANNPFTKDMLNEKRHLLEDVSHRVVLGDEYLDVLLVPLRDAQGNTNLHYLIRLKKAEDFMLAQNSTGSYYYSAAVDVKVKTPEGRLIFSEERDLSRTVDAETLSRVKDKLFGFVGVLPLPPGKYKLELVLANKLNKTSFRSEKEVVIPGAVDSGLRLSEVVPFTAAAESKSGIPGPFQVGTVKFTPAVSDGFTLIQGQNLDFFYQIWASPQTAKAAPGQQLTAEYAFGRMGLHDTKTVTDQLDKQQFDPSGSLINGKRIPTVDLPPGQYRLTVTVTDPETHERAFASVAFRIAISGGEAESWITADPDLESESRNGTFDLQRALCYWANGNTAAGTETLERAFSRNPSNEVVVGRLVNSLFTMQAFKKITAVYAKSGITAKTDEETILHVAESFDKVGETAKSVEVLESAVNLKPQSGPLYLSLAGFYHRLGNTQKANEMEQKGRNLVHNSAQSGS